MGKGTLRMSVAMSLSLFAIMLVVMMAATFVSIQLVKSGIVERGHMNPIWIPAIASVIVGTGLGCWMSRLIIAPIQEISEAAKQIADGNFEVSLRSSSRVREVRELAQNFTAMARELSQIQMLRNDFVGNVSHEFKTPLAAIEGYAVLLQSKTLSDERRAACTAKIVHSVKRLSALTGNILMLSRLDNGQMDERMVFFSLDEQIRQAILALEDRWAPKGIDLDIRLDEVTLYGHEELLAQVWQNLVGNAAKFVGEGGHIGVTLYCEGQRAVVRVTDDGPGMSEEVRKRVFERFYQGESSHTSEGNGLGLALVKRIVELHSGSVSVKSAPGEGSEFTVELPQAMAVLGE